LLRFQPGAPRGSTDSNIADIIRSMPRLPRQRSLLELRLTRGRGGPRRGAGRPRMYARPPVHHVRRTRVASRFPCHVRLRVRAGVPSLRQKRFIRAFRRSLRSCCERGGFRIVHYSIQRTHVHLLVEAAGKQALGRGMKAVGARLARAVNRIFERRGPVLFGRYWLRVLRTPREVRHALAYVLLNSRKHFFEARRRNPPAVLDVCSSGVWFDGWRSRPARGDPAIQPRAPDVSAARTWLLGKGWRRHGLLDPSEVPGS